MACTRMSACVFVSFINLIVMLFFFIQLNTFLFFILCLQRMMLANFSNIKNKQTRFFVLPEWLKYHVSPDKNQTNTHTYTHIKLWDFKQEVICLCAHKSIAIDNLWLTTIFASSLMNPMQQILKTNCFMSSATDVLW